MENFLLIGAVIGTIVGLLHAVHVFGERMTRGTGGVLAAGWFAIWTLALWTLFGAYVLAFWIIGAAAMVLSRLRFPRRAGT